MPATYLYLNQLQRVLGQDKIVFQNLPIISRTSRQCYLSVDLFGIQFAGTNIDVQPIIKLNIASENYYSSDNDGVVICTLEPTRIATNVSVYQLSMGSGEPIRIMTNDNYNRLEFTIIGSDGLQINVLDTTQISIVLKFEYPEIDSVQEQYVATIPKNLL